MDFETLRAEWDQLDRIEQLLFLWLAGNVLIQAQLLGKMQRELRALAWGGAFRGR